MPTSCCAGSRVSLRKASMPESLPPAIALSGTCTCPPGGADELLMDDAVRIAEKMKNSRVDVTIEVFPEMQHVFQFGAGTLPEADDAVARLGEFARKHLGS